MYRSIPLIITYMVTFAFCGVGIAYESSMMMCGSSDCLYLLIKAGKGEAITAEEQVVVDRIILYWKVKQQLSIALGLA